MLEKLNPALKRWLWITLKVALGLLFLAAMSAFSAELCPLIFPSLSDPVHEPTVKDFRGKYFPLPGTSQLLQKQYPGAETWLDLKDDGSFEFNALPTGSGQMTPNGQGSWKISKYRHYILSLTWLNDQGQSDGAILRIKGQKPPFIIEEWCNPSLCSLEFTTDWERSPARRAYTILSDADWVFQGFFVLFVLVFPWILPPGSRGGFFGYPFIVVFAWGIWRMSYYDPTTSNDIPGTGYIVIAFGCSLIASFLYAIRCTFLKWRTKC